MSAEQGIGRPGAAAQWREGEQFAEQCGLASARFVVERRAKLFTVAIEEWRQSRSDKRPIQILDAGCGDGINLEVLSRALSARNVTFTLVGMDYNPLRLERARVLAVADRLIRSSLTQAPFDDGSFDLVLCNQVIEHIPQPGRAAAEIARLLRPGGMAIIGVPNEGCALAQLRNRFLQRSILRTTDHVNFFSRESLGRLLDGSGLHVSVIRSDGFFVPHLRLYGLAMASASGRALLEGLGRALPSQAADLIAMATRKA